MQANIITIQNDPAGNDVIVPEEYTRTQPLLNKTVYEGPQHTLESKDTLTLSRQYAKANAISRGSAKSSIKNTLDVLVPNSKGDGEITMVAVVETTYSLPIGISEADALALCERNHALTGDRAVRDQLVNKLHV